MGLFWLVMGALSCHAQFFAPSFAAPSLPSFTTSSRPSFTTSSVPSFTSFTASPSFASSLPSFAASVPFAFSQSFGLPAATSKKSDPGIYSPVPPPTDPAASQALINLLTNPSDVVIDDSSKTAQANTLYDQNSFRSFNIEIPAQNVAIMNSDPTKEYRVHCSITTDYNTPQARTFNDFGVGCAYRGSVGSLRVCLDENHQNTHVCRKLSIRVDARAFSQKNGTKSPLIHGQRTLLFGGMPVDLSMMSERTAYYLMNSLGMIGPKSVHAKLFENGKYLGLFALVQPIDEEFTEARFGNDARQGKGGLYKELWFNPTHMNDLRDSHEDGANDDDFMRQVMAAIQQTPLSGNAPTQFFQQYFDLNSFIDMIAFNTAIGATDDWRLRHNFYIYVRDDGFGKKLVWIPWDYDRLYDPAAATRGTLQGRPWWDIASTATPTACNQQLVSPYSQAAALGGTAAKIAWNADIIQQQSVDLAIPITCDKLTQLMAAALGPAIRQRTIQMASQINVAQIRQLWNVWNAQIQTALQRDPSGPTIPVMLANQQVLAQHFTSSLQQAVSQASMVGQSGSLPSSRSLVTSQVMSSVPSFAASPFQASLVQISSQPPVFQSPMFQTFSQPITIVFG